MGMDRKSINSFQKHCFSSLPNTTANFEKGFTYIELMVAVVLLVGGLLATMAVIGVSLDLTQTTRNETAAMNAARQMVETMQDNYAFSDIYRAYNSNNADDPSGIDADPGPNFPVPRLNVQAGDADGMAGEILFPETAGQLREDINDALLGMPMDLGAPTGVDGDDHSANYVLLPVTIQISWSDGGQNKTYALRTLLSER
jgi:type II secretory pathway pseudopilin PulG